MNLNLNDYAEVPRSLVLYDVGGLRYVHSKLCNDI